MSISATSKALIKLLEVNLTANGRDRIGGIDLKPVSSAKYDDNTNNKVTLLLYRITTDRHARHKKIVKPESPGEQLSALALELYYILTVWSDNPDAQQMVMAECLFILDHFAVLSKEMLENFVPDSVWSQGTEIKIQMDSVSNEDMLRLWDSFEPSYQLSVPYLVRTVLLDTYQASDAKMVENRTLGTIQRRPYESDR